ncbi:MAG: T9SS type A sorting domain-containing protein [Vicingus serpentipes]|nr:T9SS type A sorting domain-containing protein [Vicingus serpentipes]
MNTFTGLPTLTAPSQPLTIGDRADGATNSNAKYDNVRAWSGVRSDAEILANKDLCLTGSEPGLELLFQMEEGSGTVLNDLATTDGAQNGTVVGSATWSTGFSCTVCSIADQTVSSNVTTSCDSANVTISLGSSENGVNYYLRNDVNDTVIDGPISGTGGATSFNSETITSTTTYNVLATSSEDGFITSPGHSTLSGTASNIPTGGNEYTIEVWVNSSSISGAMGLVGWGNYGSTNQCNAFRFNGSSQLRNYWWGNDLVATTPDLNDGQWHHLIATYDGTTNAIYVDGVLMGSRVIAAPNVGSANNLEIGSTYNGFEPINGSLDNIKIWNVGISSAAEAVTLMNGCPDPSTEPNLVAYYKFNEGTGTSINDVTANSNDIVAPGGTWGTGHTLCASCSKEMSSTVTVTINSSVSNTQILTECDGFSITVNGNTYNSTGTYIDTLIGGAINGCDSIVTTDLTILPALAGSVTSTICNDGSVDVNGVTYDASNPTGTEVFTNVGPNNCDSTVTVNLNVLPAKTGSVTTTICNDGSVDVNGVTYDASNPTGTEIFTNVGSNNCDSTVTVNLNVLAAKTGTITQTICFGDSIIVNGTVYKTTVTGATETFTNVGSNNCDSVVTINLTVSPTIDITVSNSSPTLTANQAGASYQWLDCDNSNAIIPSETAQIFTASVNGNYAVEIVVGSCIDTSVCEAVTGVGIEEKSNQEVLIYPNPTNGVVTIDLGSNTDLVNYSITTIDGKIVISGKTSQNLIKVDLSNESKGVYFLQITYQRGNRMYKILKG